MKRFTKEIKIALVAIVGLVLLFFGMNYLKGVSIFSSDNTYFIKFTNISGLAPACPIMMEGYKVGTVKEIQFNYDKPGEVIAKVSINSNLKIPEGTTAEISSDLLGNVQVDLLLSEVNDGILQPGAFIQGSLNAGTMGKVKEMIPQIESMIPKLDSILASINYILADPALPNTLHNAEAVTGDLTKTTTQLNGLMAELNKDVPGLIGKADGVLSQAGTAMGNATTLTDNLSKLDLESTLTELNSTLNNLKTFSEALNDQNGSLGKLLNDKSLYDNLSQTIAHADSLVVNLKENPKRYVHFSVFGKKSK